MIANTGADDGHCCLLYTGIGFLYSIEAEIQMNITVATNCSLILIWIYSKGGNRLPLAAGQIIISGRNRLKQAWNANQLVNR